MRKLLWALAATACAIAVTPASADHGWSEFEPVRRGQDRPLLFFAPQGIGSGERFVSWDDGYFRNGGGVSVRSNRALFDYDRDYPYEYSSHSAMAEAEWDEMEPREPYCTFESVRDAEGGGRTEVRICRN